MSPRSVSRWLAPLALLVCLLAVLFVVTGSTGDEESENGATPTTEERREARRGSTGTDGTGTSGRTSTTGRRRTYTVRPGDTLALISERTGVTVEELQDLNPEIDPNSLTVGDKIRLTE
jgi:LysM repeat protein